MQVVCAVLAEEVTGSPLVIRNVIDAHFGPEPAIANIKFAVVLRAGPEDYGQSLLFSCRVVDFDGKLIADAPSQIEVHTPLSPPFPEWSHNIPCEFLGVRLPRHGRYEIEILLDGRRVQHIPLNFAPPPT